MDATEKLSKVRLITLFAALIGLGLTVIITFAREGDAFGGDDLAVLLIVGSPFILALASFRLSHPRQQRWVWLASALLATAFGLPFVFSGVGFFFLAIAICFGWAFALTGPRQSSASSQQPGAHTG